ncbi:hypothetical protein E4U42_003766 [Claviceps africana]|uniref:Ubiquitin-like protease family profile domain-containing protein n=1 Tax=Claviceps africana TaxID=83212 RepID=A0A8K0J8P7_9HYPO|nr:hypothetical protein E4U42_003766 [Claviceps africana]
MALKSSASSSPTNPPRRLKSASSSLPSSHPSEAAVVHGETASISKLESSQSTKDTKDTKFLDQKPHPQTKRRRPSSWEYVLLGHTTISALLLPFTHPQSSPLARYYSEAHSFPDYGTASDTMSQAWLRELNGSAAGGLNTLTNPPLPLRPQYSPGEGSRSKRGRPSDAQDSSYSPYFPTSKRHRVNETHDLTFSDSQDDPYDFRSNSSTGKSKFARVGVEEFRHAQPKSNAVRRSRTRKSRSSLSRQHSSLDDTVLNGGNDNCNPPDPSKNSASLDTPDILLAESDPPPSSVRSDLVRPGPKRARLPCQTETTSPHFKRPRIHQSVESIESEDELSKTEHQQKQRMKFSDRFDPGRTSSSRGDIQPTQFLKPRPKPSVAPGPASNGLQVHVKRAVSGKNIFAGASDQHPLLLQRAGGQSPLLLLPEYERDAQSPLDWLAINLENVTKIEHAATQTHFVHVVRPRSNHYESSLWLEVMDHRDVLNFISTINRNQLVERSADELEIKWEQAWNKAIKYRDSMNGVRPSPFVPNAQPNELETAVNNRPSDKDDTVAGPRRTVKLVDQMRESIRYAQALSIKTSEETNDAAVVKEPGTRRTGRSSSVLHSPQEPSPERWTDVNPDWRAQWHRSLVFPATGKNRATVDDGDIVRLDEGEFLNDNLISFYIRYLQYRLESDRPELLSKVYFFSTFFFEKLRSTKGKVNYDGVRAWTAKVDLLSYDYIVVPVNEYAHWYLAVICNVPNAVKGMPQEGGNEETSEHVKDSSPRIAAIERDMSDVTIQDGGTKRQSAGDVETLGLLPSSPKTTHNSSPLSKTTAPPGSQTSTATQRHDDPRTPKIVTLDSLASAHPTTCKVLREYLIAEAKDKRGIDLVKAPHGMTAKKIPEQDNFCDCGVFVLGYMEEFLKDPDETVRKLLQREPLGWDIRPSQIRESLRDLLFEMQREQHERDMKEKEQKRLAAAKKKALAKEANLSTGRAAKRVSLPPGSISSAPEVPGSSDVTTVTPRSSPAVVRADVADVARNSQTQVVAKSPPRGRRLFKGDAASSKAPRVDASTDNKAKAITGGLHGLDSSSRRHEPVQDGMAAYKTKKPTATTSATAADVSKHDIVKPLPISSSEAEGQRTRTQHKRMSVKSSADVEEVMAITRSRPTRQTSKQLGSSPSLVQPLRSSQSPSLTRLQAKYDGVERSVDLT